MQHLYIRSTLGKQYSGEYTGKIILKDYGTHTQAHTLHTVCSSNKSIKIQGLSPLWVLHNPKHTLSWCVGKTKRPGEDEKTHRVSQHLLVRNTAEAERYSRSTVTRDKNSATEFSPKVVR